MDVRFGAPGRIELVSSVRNFWVLGADCSPTRASIYNECFVIIFAMPKIVDHDEYRRKIIDASFEIIAKRGYAAVSMRDLARTLRISTGTLYYYFPNKLGLFEAILRKYGVDDMKKQAPDNINSPSFEDGVELLIEGMKRQEALWAKLLLVQVDAYREPEGKLLSAFNTVFTSENTRDYLSNLLHIKNTDVLDTIRALMLGLIIQRVIGKRKVDWQVQKSVILETFAVHASVRSGG